MTSVTNFLLLRADQVPETQLGGTVYSVVSLLPQPCGSYYCRSKLRLKTGSVSCLKIESFPPPAVISKSTSFPRAQKKALAKGKKSRSERGWLQRDCSVGTGDLERRGKSRVCPLFFLFMVGSCLFDIRESGSMK